MKREEIQKIIEETMIKDYSVDISQLPADTPISRIRELSPKLDSLEFLQFLFGIEDKTGIELPEGNFVPKTLGDILDEFDKAANS